MTPTINTKNKQISNELKNSLNKIINLEEYKDKKIQFKRVLSYKKILRTKLGYSIICWIGAKYIKFVSITNKWSFINKKYVEIMHQANNAVGRKEVVRLLKKAAQIKPIFDENFVA